MCGTGIGHLGVTSKAEVSAWSHLTHCGFIMY